MAAYSSQPVNPILVIGEYNVGKTHYGAQLLQRLNAQTGSFRMRSAAEDVRPFEAAMLRINQGLAAEHTAATMFSKTVLPVEIEGRALDLVWPEYGGEQINEILTARRFNETWRDRARASTGWLIMVRASNTDATDDILARPLYQLSEAKAVTPPYRHTTQARMVELLQMLLFVRGADPANAADLPNITIVLTCWDELPGTHGNELPAKQLESALPLLSHYVSSIWPLGQRSVVGLSALERELNRESPDEGFQTQGPESFGYVVLEDGSRSSDLSLPLRHLAGLR
jgi:hypothetical protein